METLKRKLASRKLIVAVLSAVAIALNDRFKLGLGTETVNAIVWIASAYIVGEGLPDAAGAISAALVRKDGNANVEGTAQSQGGSK